MHKLIALLGRAVDSPQSLTILSRFVGLTPDVLDLAPDEGLPKDYYLTSLAEGISIKHKEDGEITSIFLMNENRHGYSRFSGVLLNNLSFSSTPADVRTALGTPSFERPASSGNIPFGHGALMRFDRPDHSIHFQFLESGMGVELVTLMSASSVPSLSHER